MIKRLNLVIGCTLLVSSILFNLILYRSEPTVQIDPNDNAFQFALVERTNEIWTYADRTCSNSFQIICHIGYLTDHWVPNWAEGYNLPTYYSHVPQILVVGTYRLFSYFDIRISDFSLFTYYHLIIYLLLCLFPLSIFLSLKILKNSWLTAGIGAVFTALISTDGLYGLDPSSYLWRGWGLSSQLFGAIFLPIAIAYAIRACETPTRKKYYALSVLFLTCATAGHLGIGLMGFLALPVIAFTPTFLSILHTEHIKIIWRTFEIGLKNLLKLAIPPLIILSYWIIPTVLLGKYHNVSFWDPIWKFDSYGAREVLVNFFNGNLFDFERFPILTILVCTGLFVCLRNIPSFVRFNRTSEGEQASPLPFLFLFFLLLYFGTTTWGTLLYLIPSMNEFHQHRFIVGIHLMGLLLAPIGLTWLISFVASKITTKTNMKYDPLYYILLCIVTIPLILILLPRTLSYGTYNDELIRKSVSSFETTRTDAELLISTLKSLPRGRVFAGRGGSWGKEFKIGGVPAYMYLSTYGIPTILWMPETWSPSTDVEQSFIEHDPSHYDLFDVKYVVTPPNMPEGTDVQKFWKLVKETATWKLYTVDVSGAVTTGTAPSIVYIDKYTYKNLVRLWIQEPVKTKYIYPELRLDRPDKTNAILPWFSMTDPYSYETPDGKTHHLFTEPPKYMTPWEWPQAFPQYQSSFSDFDIRISDFKLPIKVLSQSSDSDMIFRATVEVDGQKTPNNTKYQIPDTRYNVACPTCVVVLKQTFAPGWKATLNGKPTQTIIVFPFYIAVRLEEAGTYDIVFTYTPSRLKVTLLFLPLVLLILWGIFLKMKTK